MRSVLLHRTAPRCPQACLLRCQTASPRDRRVLFDRRPSHHHHACAVHLSRLNSPLAAPLLECRARRLHARHPRKGLLQLRRRIVDTRCTCRSSPSHQNRLCCALHCRLQPAHTLHPSLHTTTPDAVVEGRIAHPSTHHALGHGYRQSCHCASHRWRAQTCDACPERGGPVEERFGQLVEAVQEE